MRKAVNSNDMPCYHPKPGGKARVHTVVAKLIRRNDGMIYRFADLPLVAQLVIAHYMGVDGEAWLDFEDLGVFKGLQNWENTGREYKRVQKHNATRTVTNLTKAMPKIVEKRADAEFGLVTVPTSELGAAWKKIGSEGSKDFDDLDAYHKWYQERGNRVPNPTWPVILSSFADELLQDGWNRFHSYIGMKAETIDCLWYPENGVEVSD